MNAATGRLWVVATPIGHLDDMSARAVEVLKRVERIAADYGSLGADASKVTEFLQRSRDAARQASAPISFRARTQAVVGLGRTLVRSNRIGNFNETRAQVGLMQNF